MEADKGVMSDERKKQLEKMTAGLATAIIGLKEAAEVVHLIGEDVPEIPVKALIFLCEQTNSIEFFLQGVRSMLRVSAIKQAAKLFS